MTQTDLRAKRELRAAIIGTGRIGDLYDDGIVHVPGMELPSGIVHSSMYSVKPVAHAAAYKSVEGFRLVAGANRGKERLRDFGKRNGIDALYTDYRQMLVQEQPDVVSVCTRSPEKRDAVLACADAGIPAVVVEKAFATSLSEADQMLAACRLSGTFLAVNHPMRFSPMFRHLLKLIDEGSIGKLSSITCNSGLILHMGTHDMDLMRWFAGNPKRVVAWISGIEKSESLKSGLPFMDVPGDGCIEFETGVMGVYLGSKPSTMGFDLRGSEGYMTVPRSMGLLSLIQRREGSDPNLLGALRGRTSSSIRWEESVAPAWPNCRIADEASAMVLFFRELFESLTKGVPFASTGADGAAALELCIAFYYSSLMGTSVSLPLVERDLKVNNR